MCLSKRGQGQTRGWTSWTQLPVLLLHPNIWKARSSLLYPKTLPMASPGAPTNFSLEEFRAGRLSCLLHKATQSWRRGGGVSVCGARASEHREQGMREASLESPSHQPYDGVGRCPTWRPHCLSQATRLWAFGNLEHGQSGLPSLWRQHSSTRGDQAHF